VGFIRDLTGKTAATAAKASGELQRGQAFESATDVDRAGLVSRTQVGRAGREAGDLLDPFAEVGAQGLDLAGFLGDPTAQFDFLQNNPLFQSALESANVRTEQRAASRGRLSAGDTLEQLTANTLQTARPFLQDQRSDILNLLNLGRGVASEQGGILQNTAGNLANIRGGTAADVANLRTGGTSAQAAGQVGAANVRGQAASNLLSGGIQLAGLFSDERLKEKIKPIGFENGHNIYKWAWNKVANALGLFGESRGVIAQQVKETNPEAISYDRGFMKVNYEMIGVNHGD
jgi:hypothetical protein